jgi:hypothetical protein
MHATASVDDLDQSLPGGPFLWVRHAVTTVRSVDLARGIVDAEHDGYRRLHEPVTHRRWLVAPPDWPVTVVVDLFTGAGVHRLRTAWPLHPDLAARKAAHTAESVHHVERAGAPVLAIATAATAPTVGYAVHGDSEQRLGWWSHRFESRTPAWLVGAVADDVELPAAVASVLTTGEAPTDLAVHLDDSVIDVSWAGRWSVRIDTGAAGAVSCSSAGGA